MTDVRMETRKHVLTHAKTNHLQGLVSSAKPGRAWPRSVCIATLEFICTVHSTTNKRVSHKGPIIVVCFLFICAAHRLGKRNITKKRSLYNDDMWLAIELWFGYARWTSALWSTNNMLWTMARECMSACGKTKVLFDRRGVRRKRNAATGCT